MNLQSQSIRRSWRIEAARTYDANFVASERIFEPANDVLAQAVDLQPGARRFVVVDANVYDLYGARIRSYFAAWKAEIEVYVMEANESQKTLATVESIVRRLDSFGIRRHSDPIIAVGGGVVTDTVGCAAQLYRRGTPHVRIPTTLVGLIDAGIGLKVGVNFNGKKNLLGSFQGPVASVLDCTFLKTLPDRQVRSGVAELIKLAVVCDRVLFALLETCVSEAVSAPFALAMTYEIIDRAITTMLGQLSSNPWERELRRRVDFGHTFSPRLELDSGGELMHGEAVAVDIALCCQIALGRGLLNSANAARVFRLLSACCLPAYHELCTSRRLCAALDESTKHRGGRQHLFLPTEVGDGEFVEDISPADIRKAVAACQAGPGGLDR